MYQPPTKRVACAMTDRLADTMAALADEIVQGTERGERYAVEITVTGPLTVEEAITVLWERVMISQAKLEVAETDPNAARTNGTGT